MSDFYKNLLEKNHIADAYIVLKNLLSKDPENVDYFNEFIRLSLEIAMYGITYEERKQYMSDANVALSVFSERAEMNENTLAIIKETQKKLGDTYAKIYEEEEAYYNEQRSIIQNENTKLLAKLSDELLAMDKAKIQGEFDRILEEVAKIDSMLEKDYFSKTQNDTYSDLTKQYSDLIGRKMEELNHRSLLAYNKKAVLCFRKVLDAFKKDSCKYKNESNLKSLMTSNFFAFDTSKLFNESLVYYNHVYSVVFQEVDENMKYKLTEWALTTSKTGR